MKEMHETIATSSSRLTNEIGLHARPSVKLTKLAKSFASRIEVAASPEGPWVDAKSIVKVMAFKAAKGDTLHFRASGPDAEPALAALRRLVDAAFHEEEGSAAGAGSGAGHG
jgi:phosphocarrier protein